MKKEEKVEIPPLWPMGLPTQPPIVADSNGSYTGKPAERMEIPIQDVDDL